MTENQNTSQKISKEESKLLSQVFRRICFIFGGANNVNMLGRGFLYAMLPVIDKYYSDPEDRKEAMTRHLEFFNTHSVCAGFIAGLVTGMEKERAEKGTIDGETITKIKASLMGPLAGIGDSFFFNCLRVIAGGIAIGFASTGNILGPLFFILIYGMPQMVSKFYLVRIGFQSGTTLIDKAFSSGIIPMITKAAGIVGMTMVGAMVANNIRINIIAAPVINGAGLNIQSLFDMIAPGILNIVIFFLIFRLVKKGKTPIVLVFSILAICVALAFLGIL